jgi:DNA-binding transcriptional regulator LsrR (DeoR family)
VKKILNKNNYMLNIEKREGELLEEILRKYYVDENLSVNEISKRLQISYVTIIRWLNLAGIYSRRLKL